MNILRWRRKSKKKIKFKTLLLFACSLIMTTFAWFAYAKVLSPTLNIHMSSWDMKYYIGGQEKTNPIAIQIPTLYPAMPEQSVTVNIENNGETLVDIDYQISSLTIAGTTYELVYEGVAPTETNYIILGAPVLETDSGTGKKIYKAAIINDISEYPFTIEIEHTAQVAAGTTEYLKVTVNWVGDNNKLDTEWGYRVGEYLTTTGASSAITMEISIDSYQAENQAGGELVAPGILPSTTETIPYLPTGFSKVPGTTLDTGLVIKDPSGNEYVWIEVPKTATVYATAGLGLTTFSTTEYTNIENDLKAYSAEYRTQEEVKSYTGTGVSDTKYKNFKDAMLQSVYKNGGFYIGRYETGCTENPRNINSTTTSETPVIKQNAYPFNYVTCAQAQSLASGMESGTYTSSIMFGLQWDLVMTYLAKKGALPDNDAIKVDSTNWGNYKNNTYAITRPNANYSLDEGVNWLASPYEKEDDETSVILTTGANSTYSKQNIFDLAGNLTEWTFNLSFSGSTPVGGNGGDFTKEGTNSASIVNNEYKLTEKYKQVGFRVTIY